MIDWSVLARPDFSAQRRKVVPDSRGHCDFHLFPDIPNLLSDSDHSPECIYDRVLRDDMYIVIQRGVDDLLMDVRGHHISDHICVDLFKDVVYVHVALLPTQVKAVDRVLVCFEVDGRGRIDQSVRNIRRDDMTTLVNALAAVQA
jgi:hypothetical protein